MLPKAFDHLPLAGLRAELVNSEKESDVFITYAAVGNELAACDTMSVQSSQMDIRLSSPGGGGSLHLSPSNDGAGQTGTCGGNEHTNVFGH